MFALDEYLNSSLQVGEVRSVFAGIAADAAHIGADTADIAALLVEPCVQGGELAVEVSTQRVRVAVLHVVSHDVKDGAVLVSALPAFALPAENNDQRGDCR